MRCKSYQDERCILKLSLILIKVKFFSVCRTLVTGTMLVSTTRRRIGGSDGWCRQSCCTVKWILLRHIPAFVSAIRWKDWRVLGFMHLNSLWQYGMDTSLRRNCCMCYMFRKHPRPALYLDYAHRQNKLCSPCIGIVCRCRVIVVPAEQNQSCTDLKGARLSSRHLFCWDSSKPLILPPYLIFGFQKTK